MHLRFVEYGSREWLEARELRYTLFFLPHRLGPEVMDDAQEAYAMHAVILEAGAVVGCARLFSAGQGKFQISQMAVLPARQGQGIGHMLLKKLVGQAASLGATSVELRARLTAVPFYTRAGFLPDGEAFVSEKTGVPHVNMKLELSGPGASLSWRGEEGK